ncbi:LOW QUALITY PROTEIN: hypothetical protein CRUP_013873, partial [Coryphaenoides rupestris]
GEAGGLQTGSSYGEETEGGHPDSGRRETQHGAVQGPGGQAELPHEAVEAAAGGGRGGGAEGQRQPQEAAAGAGGRHRVGRRHEPRTPSRGQDEAQRLPPPQHASLRQPRGGATRRRSL